MKSFNEKLIPLVNQYTAIVRIKPFDNSLDMIEAIANTIVDTLHLHVVKKISHMFSPQGISLLYILAQSHLVIHTWPEFGFIHLDMVICSDRTKQQFKDAVHNAFSGYQPLSIDAKVISIGHEDSSANK